MLLARVGCRIVGTGADVGEGLALIEERRPDVTLIDVDADRPGGLALAQAVSASHGGGAVVLHASDATAAALQGRRGPDRHAIVLKSAGLRELLEALTAAGGAPPSAARLPFESPLAAGLSVLSRREREIMELLSDGLTGEQVARELVLSIQTVKTHIRNAMLKLEASTRVHAIAIAIRRGYITGPGALLIPVDTGAVARIPAGHGSVPA